ncbi:DUF4249 domain-containing protein [Pedobacter immunditicola]|uniref:DUF4249 domain-containing protein n=1 Tax=Pedobacter immunditicola TaxID=3133440 RepID=UPI0030B7BABA
MLKHIKYLGFLIAVSVSICSCEKVIEVEQDTSSNQIVIEGNITNQLGQQTIKISQSVPYTDNNTYPPVTGAIVNVTDDEGRSWIFKESAPGSYTFAPLRGKTGQTYSLKISVNNLIFTASSTMPNLVEIDSLHVREFEFGGEAQKQMGVHYRDPADVANQYRFVMKINGVQSKRVYAENDRFINGNYTSSILFYSGDDDDDLKTGDDVEVEMQCIDKNIFTYWYTLSQQTQNGPGGGVTPGNPPSNISNNALGYFSAHTVSRSQTKIK